MANFKFGSRSVRMLVTCHPDLQLLMNESLKTCPVDMVILCGFRNELFQHNAFMDGRSQLDWPYSKHNKFPSNAVDVAPYNNGTPHIEWEDISKFNQILDHIQATADQLGIQIRLGRTFSFHDYPHVELMQ